MFLFICVVYGAKVQKNPEFENFCGIFLKD